MILKPQEGAQEKFLSSSADIVIYGGAAGGGKTYALLLEPLRHVTRNPDFFCTIFRRTTPQIRNHGGLWDESAKLYTQISTATPLESTLQWKFNGGGKIKFAHLDHEKDVHNYQGSQIPLICFDELTHFSRMQFFYLLSRNRSTCGVIPYIRATTNPDCDSWVAEFIEWWIDDKGYAIPERSGIVRWFVILNDTVYWADSKKECLLLYKNEALEDNDDNQIKPKSFTFIAATLSDNKALTSADPNYRANLEALPTVEKERLLYGNWKVKRTASLVFKNWKIDNSIEWDSKQPLYFGSDFGFANDPTTLLRCWVDLKQRLIFIDYEAYGIGVEIDHTPQLFNSVPESTRFKITADSARPETISYLNRNGFNVVGARKGAGSVDEGIKFLQSYTIIVHSRCKHTIDELSTYSYKTDRVTGEILPILEDKNNHMIDAVRYSLELFAFKSKGIAPSTAGSRIIK